MMAILGLTETQILIQQPNNIYALVTAGPLKVVVKYGRFVAGEFQTVAFCDYPPMPLHDGYGWNLEHLNTLLNAQPESVTALIDRHPTDAFFDQFNLYKGSKSE